MRATYCRAAVVLSPLFVILPLVLLFSFLPVFALLLFAVPVPLAHREARAPTLTASKSCTLLGSISLHYVRAEHEGAQPHDGDGPSSRGDTTVRPGDALSLYPAAGYWYIEYTEMALFSNTVLDSAASTFMRASREDRETRNCADSGSRIHSIVDSGIRILERDDH